MCHSRRARVENEIYKLRAVRLDSAGDWILREPGHIGVGRAIRQLARIGEADGQAIGQGRGVIGVLQARDGVALDASRGTLPVIAPVIGEV